MYHFIVNPNARSGLGQKVWSNLEIILKTRNIDYEVHFTKYQKHATMLTKKITSDGKSASSITAINKTDSGKITSVNGSKITIGQKDYTLSDNVQIYLKKSYDYTMLNIDELKNEMSNYSAAIYQDKTEASGGRVRVIILS